MKMLFRIWLRKKIITLSGSSKYMEEKFHWIYDAPVIQWRDRLWCLEKSTSLLEAKELFLLLHKYSNG